MRNWGAFVQQLLHQKIKGFIYSKCPSAALFIQHAKRMRHIILSTVVCPALPNFFTLFPKRHNFRKKKIEHRICVLISRHILSETFLIVTRNERNIITNLHRISCKVPLFLSDFISLGFSRQIFEKSAYIKFHYIQSSGSRVVP